jgi:transcription initiation factor IIE alpha subunit
MICRICGEAKEASQLVINHTTPVKVHYKDICKVCAGKKTKIVNGLKKMHDYPGVDYSCPICLKLAPKYYFDHDWQTNKFRGWLCNGCNIALGLLKDDRDILLRAIEYLAASTKNEVIP